MLEFEGDGRQNLDLRQAFNRSCLRGIHLSCLNLGTVAWGRFCRFSLMRQIVARVVSTRGPAVRGCVLGRLFRVDAVWELGLIPY